MLDIDPLVVKFSIERERISESEGFIQIRVDLVKNRILLIFEFYTKSQGVTTYRYHLMNEKQELLARWDNAPHHPELSTFPHHYHLPTGVKEWGQIPLQQLLNLLPNYLD